MKKLEDMTSHNLRQRAEERLNSRPPLPQDLSAAETARLIHELQVHQIELEMQNEELHKAQVGLEESRQRYADLYDSAPVGYLTLSSLGKILEANLTAAHLLGIDRSRLVGLNLPTFLIDPDCRRLHHVLNRSESRPKSRGEYRLQRQNGEILTLLLDLVYSPGPSGDDRWHVAVTDITDIPELKQTQMELHLYQDLLEEMVADRTANLEQTLEELRKAKENHEAIFQAAPVTIGVFDAQGRLVDLNPAGEGTFGWSRAEAQGHLVPSIPSKSPEASLALMERVLKGEAIVGVELQQQRRDGSLLDVRLSLAPLHDRQGGVRGFMALAEDITASKRTEAAILRAKQEWERTFDAVPDLIAILDREHTIIRVNRAMAAAVNLKPQDLVGRKCHTIVHKTSSPLPFCPHSQLLADGREHTAEVQALDRMFLVSASPLTDPQGKIIGSVHVARDLTAQKQLELELRGSQERLNLALAAAKMGVWEWDIQTDATFYSPECGAFLGLEGSWGKLASFTGSIHSEDLARVKAEVRRVLAEKIDYVDEFRIIRLDGEVRWAANVGRVHYDASGAPQRLIGAIQDITERKNAESEKAGLQEQLLQAQKMEAIGTLAGGIAHDFNNLLWAILGYAEMAVYASDNPVTVREYLDQVLRAGQRAKELVGQILAFSRRLETDKKPLILRLIVAEASKLLRASLPVTIEIRQDIASHRAILADATQIHQVIMNLATNAFHAMEETGGVLAVSLEDITISSPLPVVQGELPPGDYVRLTVRDTGPGIPAGILSRIFEPYFTTKEVGKGTGMGLATVLGIVKSHGGDIAVASQPAQGTAFSLYFPALLEPQTSFSPVIETELPRGSGRILFVDDEPELAELGQIILGNLGYTVTSTTSSLESLEIFRALPQAYDLVITDLTMPELTGQDLVQHLQHIRPDIPIVICTGYRDKLSREDIQKLGIKEVLIKPVDPRQLAEVVRRLLSPAADQLIR